MVQNSSNGYDATVLKLVFGLSMSRTTKQMKFLESWDETGQNWYVFERKFWFSKFDLFWPKRELKGKKGRQTLLHIWP